MAKRAAQGSGTIRKKTVTRSGKQYTYWEARATVGRDPGTGRQIQRSITGKTQREVREKLQAAAVAVNEGTYTTPSRITVGEWLDAWAAEYLTGRKPNTVRIYKNNISRHIKPALGAVRLDKLRPHAVQGFVNGLSELAPATVRLIHKTLHQALEKAVSLGYIPRNPAARCELPKLEQKEIIPLTDEQVAALLRAAQGTDMEYLVTVALFTGLRLSELLGLTWNAVDMKRGTITVNKQLSRPDQREGGLFISPKNGKARIITAAASVVKALQAQKRRQSELRLKAGAMWCNSHDLVFTTEAGDPLDQWRAEAGFSRVLTAAGLEGVRFHDLRHTYAVNAIRAGDDIKTIQGNLGHSSAAFTLDKYGHFTERMKQDSAQRMEGFIKGVLSL